MTRAVRRGVLRTVREDLAAARRGDPAARSDLENAVVYSGLHAIWTYRLTHRLWLAEGLPGSRFAARLIAQLARTVTGIEIHPGARIGRRFFIDHGMGVVIGETAVIGDDVLVFHGVTLGGRGNHGGEHGPGGRRHPAVGDRVVLGAGSSLIGAITVGADSVVGANTVVTKDVPAGSVVTGVAGTSRPRSGHEGVPTL
ncbi:serine O-acetyltransferase EpsC [Curtobacterium caseinilyticum]|uniref:Serine acetyltransferase n=1 Tax=Curtobacterium caseinilyticum TaxID=3055137 RepID=A0ABT7TMN3_9MICO|nr:serine O-acetyltransferase EpsC [Curtobacterium caseinilyticum]MDM7890846.1 serine O-acetyltransferase [Curtobacterium caseinilyticum]